MSTRRGRVALGAAMAAALLGGIGFTVFSGGENPYQRVASIEREPDYQDRSILERAWSQPVAHTFRDGFESQNNASFCGPTSVVDVMHSLGAQASQADVLEGSWITTIFGFVPGGITLDELANVVRQRLPDRDVTVHRDLDLASFRALLARANDPDVRLIANFHRGPLFGRGHGHHSPIGGYLSDVDRVFVLDVNDEYRPFVVASDRLFAAIDTVDGSSGRRRGVIEISAHH